jgi:hypothetical protein
MKRFRIRRPSPALIVAIIALVAATAGSAFAFGLSALSNGAKNKTVGVGKLRYVTTTVQDPADQFGPASFTNATAQCPAGLKVIGGGIKAEVVNQDFILDSYPTTTGWTGRVATGGPAGGPAHTFTTTAICAKSRKVTGAPLTG